MCKFGLPVTGRRINMFGWNLESLCVMDLRMDAHRAENERTIDLCTDYWQPKTEQRRTKKYKEKKIGYFVKN